MLCVCGAEPQLLSDGLVTQTQIPFMQRGLLGLSSLSKWETVGLKAEPELIKTSVCSWYSNIRVFL